MIQGVERLKSQLEIDALREIEVFQQRRIDGEDAGTGDRVSRKVPKGAFRLKSEGRSVEPFGCCRVWETLGYAVDSVRAIVPLARIGLVDSSLNVIGEAG